jgi:hypothetical protein
MDFVLSSDLIKVNRKISLLIVRKKDKPPEEKKLLYENLLK